MSKHLHGGLPKKLIPIIKRAEEPVVEFYCF